MPFPQRVLANADDFGYNSSANKAILLCFEKQYINSTSLMVNMPAFEEAVQMAHDRRCISNIGVHINLAEGKPLTNIGIHFLDKDGCFDLQKTGKLLSFFTTHQKAALTKEIDAQIDKALSQGIAVDHIDSHYHLHTLPGLFNLFLRAAKHFNLKMRLAQTYREGNHIKFWYRSYINNKLATHKINYSDRFETVEHFLAQGQYTNKEMVTEIMLHPGIDAEGKLTDHFDFATMANWLNYLKQLPVA